MAAGRITLRIGAQHSGAKARHHVGLGGAEGGAEIALHQHVGDAGHALRFDRRDALRPHRLGRLGVLGAGVGEHQPAQQIGVQQRQALTDHAAHRQPDPQHRAASPFADQTGRVVHQFVHRVRPVGHGRAAVAAVVVAQHRVAAHGELASQVVPQVQVQAERMAQDDGHAGGGDLGVVGHRTGRPTAAGGAALHRRPQLRLAEGVVRGHAHSGRQRRGRRQQAGFAQRVHRDLEGGVGRRHAAVDRALQQRFLDHRQRHTALLPARPDGRLAVQLELFPARQPHRHAQHQQAARGVGQRRPAPDVVPGVAGDQALELGVEIARVVERLVDPGIAQHRAAVLHAAVEIVLSVSGHGSNSRSGKGGCLST